jgi:hypothetical protein
LRETYIHAKYIKKHFVAPLDVEADQVGMVGAQHTNGGGFLAFLNRRREGSKGSVLAS